MEKPSRLEANKMHCREQLCMPPTRLPPRLFLLCEHLAGALNGDHIVFIIRIH